jgi:hypothetical protein
VSANETKPSEVNFELNMSFDMLRENQWSRVLDALWGYGHISGPFSSAASTEDEDLSITTIQYPAPTATYTQPGYLSLGEKVVGIHVLVTRSLFECISVTVAANALDENLADNQSTFLKVDTSAVEVMEDTFKRLALYLYEAAPFEIATIGWNRDCQLLAELASDEKARLRLFETGGFLAQGTVLDRLGADEGDFEEVLPGLWWMPSRQ